MELILCRGCVKKHFTSNTKVARLGTATDIKSYKILFHAGIEYATGSVTADPSAAALTVSSSWVPIDIGKLEMMKADAVLLSIIIPAYYCPTVGKAFALITTLAQDGLAISDQY